MRKLQFSPLTDLGSDETRMARAIYDSAFEADERVDFDVLYSWTTNSQRN